MHEELDTSIFIFLKSLLPKTFQRICDESDPRPSKVHDSFESAAFEQEYDLQKLFSKLSCRHLQKKMTTILSTIKSVFPGASYFTRSTVHFRGERMEHVKHFTLQKDK